jgi:hypothetical protein
MMNERLQSQDGVVGKWKCRKEEDASQEVAIAGWPVEKRG